MEVMGSIVSEEMGCITYIHTSLRLLSESESWDGICS